MWVLALLVLSAAGYMILAFVFIVSAVVYSETGSWELSIIVAFIIALFLKALWETFRIRY